MTLSTGSRLGVHEIVGLLGSGGMGEVYRARDTKLNRQVAIKVLPSAYASDPDRLARFHREAQAVAALNHPNIAAIYDLADADGTTFLVLELVEGDTLADRLRRGPVPVEEALAIARQILDALESAHEKGICHRDLKPANVKVTPDGTVKVLDFGLAKFLEATPSSASLTESPTLSLAATYPGVILGTAGYMSPEQAKGLPADHRSDLFSFGCVLYELLTGRQAFDGDTAPEILAAVLKSEVDFSALPPRLHPRLADLLRRCLQKNPKQRWHAAADVRVELGSVTGGALVVDEPRATPVAPRPLWRRAIPVTVALLVGALVAGAAAWRLKPEPTRGVARFAMILPDGEGFTGMGRPVVALSPDGSTLVYVASNRLYVRPISALDARPLVGSETWGNVTSPVVSPDGRSVAFYAGADNTLKRLDLAGGAPVTITSASNPVGMSWGDEGLVFSQADKGILRVSPDGGVPEVIVPPSPDETLAHPQLLPGGKAVLLSVKPAADEWDKGTVVAQPLGGGMRKTVVAAGAHGRYVPTGHLVYAVNGVLMAVPFDADSLSVSGGPVAIVEGIRRTSLGEGLTLGTAQFATSASGTLAFVPGPAMASASGTSNLGLFDRKGEVQPLRLPAGSYAAPRVSPDGTLVVFEVDDGQEPSVWIYELSGRTAMRRLTFGGKNRAPIWSPDGQWVVFQSDREGDLALFRQRVDGTGAAERVTKPEAGDEHIPQSLSPDGRHLLFTVRKERTWTLWTTSGRGGPGAKATPFGGVRSENGLVEGVFSPDGRWVAYQEPEPDVGGALEGRVFLQPFPATGAKYLVRHGGHPYWSPKGDQLILNVGPGPTVIVPVTTAPAVAFGQPVNFPRGGRNEGSFRAQRRNVDSHPDGQHIVGVTNEAAGQGTSRQITVVLNWFDELRARVPTR